MDSLKKNSVNFVQFLGENGEGEICQALSRFFSMVLLTSTTASNDKEVYGC